MHKKKNSSNFWLIFSFMNLVKTGLKCSLILPLQGQPRERHIWDQNQAHWGASRLSSAVVGKIIEDEKNVALTCNRVYILSWLVAMKIDIAIDEMWLSSDKKRIS